MHHCRFVQLSLDIFVSSSAKSYILTEMCSEIALSSASTGEPTRNWLAWQAPGSILSRWPELSLALVHTRRPAWPAETSETTLQVAPPRKTRPPDHTRVNWPVDPSASGSAQVGAPGEPREFRLAGSRQDKRLERAIPLTTHLWF